MRRLASLVLTVICFVVIATAQYSHVAGQVTGEFNRDSGYNAPNVGAQLSGALRFNQGVAVVGSVYGERAVKDFQSSGTAVGLRLAGRIYPLPFVFGEVGYSQDGQYNKSYVEVGHSYFAGGGLSVRDKFILGADFVSNDGTLAQIRRGRVHGDLFLPLRQHIDFKVSAEADFKSSGTNLSPPQSLDPRNFTGQGLRLGIGLSLK